VWRYVPQAVAWCGLLGLKPSNAHGASLTPTEIAPTPPVQMTESRGRAVFATRAFTEGEQVLRERPLVAIQVCARGLNRTGCSVAPLPHPAVSRAPGSTGSGLGA
jgi:hypothetical protein